MSQKNFSVLFVDDEKNVLEALRRLLLDEPYDVRICSDPELALEQITAHAPEVVVADFYMPKMNGPALLRRVRDIDASIVRIVLTGKPDVTAVLDAVQEGSVYRFCLKPWDEDELKMSLRQAIDYHHLLGERNTLLAEVDRQKETLDQLEADHPGISKLPARDSGGAYVLDRGDLPKGSQ